MSLHSPVVFTDDPALTSEARARRWPVVSRDGATLRMSGVRQSAPLPEPNMDITAGSLTGVAAGGWKFVLDWVAKYVHRPLLVLEPGSWAGDLGRWAEATRGWGWTEASEVPGKGPSLSGLDDAALVELPAAPEPPSPADRIPGRGRMLLVRHGEWTERQGAWVDAAERVGLLVDIASDRILDGRDRVHVVADLGTANLTLDAGTGPLDPVYALALARAVDSGDPTLGAAGHWQVALEHWFKPRPDDFDVVVLAGPPVGFFGFGAFASRHWYARVVIDHATHAPWPADEAAALLLKDWEQGWHLAADAVTVADELALGQVAPSGPDATVEIADGARMETLLQVLSDHSFTAM